jgi:CRISPR-associated protein Cmr4
MMMMNERSYWLHAVSPLHVGAGRGVGYIDLPIMREKVTAWPFVPGSAVKGVLADHFGASDPKERERNPLKAQAFGTAGDESNSGSLVFTDAHIICIPIRSFSGAFAWVTSPLCLVRLARDLGEENPVPAIEERGQALVAERSKIVLEERAYLEELDFSAVPSVEADAWAKRIAESVFSDDKPWMTTFQERFVIVHDDAFSFLCETGTDVAARVRIEDNSKTVAGGALWYEESLPTESILAGLVWCDKVYGRKESEKTSPEEMLNHFCGKPLHLQIGGKATVGKGLVRCMFGRGERS